MRILPSDLMVCVIRQIFIITRAEVTSVWICDWSVDLPGGPADSSFRTSCCVSMLKSPMWPVVKDVTM